MNTGRRTLPLAVTLAFCVSGAAQAQQAAPILSGSYIFTLTSICQASLSQSNGTLNMTQAGLSNLSAGVITFTPDQTGYRGTLNVNGMGESGTPILLYGSAGSSGVAMSQSQLKNTLSYANTETSLNYGPTTASVYYANVEEGIANSLTWTGLDRNNCGFVGSATRQAFIAKPQPNK